MQIEHKRGDAYYLTVPIVSKADPSIFLSLDTPTVTGWYKDGAGAWTSFTPGDVLTEIGTTGIYEMDLITTELNHDQVLIKVISTNGGDTAFLFDMKVMDDAVDLTWDEEISTSSHNDAQSAGKRLRQSGAEFAGYEDGAIWIDTINGSPGTIDYDNGTVANPVDNIADANTLAASLGIVRFRVAPGSSITFAASQIDQEFIGSRWTLALGGQDITDTSVIGALVTGTGAGTGAIFRSCDLDNGGLGNFTVGECSAFTCSIAGDLTLASAGTYYFNGCFSGVAGDATPSIDFGAAVGDMNVNIRHYSGGIEIKNMGAVGTDKMSLEGFGQLVINTNCVGGTVAIRGTFTVTDNASAAVTLSDDARYDIYQAAIEPVFLGDGAHGGAASTLTLSDYSNFVADVSAVTLADGPHGGTAATLALKKLDIIATDADADAVTITGFGNGAAIIATGGVTGHCVDLSTVGSGNYAFYCHTTGSNADAAYFDANDSFGAGIQCVGGLSGFKAYTASGNTAFQCASATGPGAEFIGGGTEPGVKIHHPGTGNGLEIAGGDFAGNSIHLTAPNGVNFSGDGSAAQLDAFFSATIAEITNVPGVTATMLEKLKWICHLSQYSRVTTDVNDKVRNAADDTNMALAAIGEVGGVFTKQAYVDGP